MYLSYQSTGRIFTQLKRQKSDIWFGEMQFYTEIKRELCCRTDSLRQILFRMFATIINDSLKSKNGMLRHQPITDSWNVENVIWSVFFEFKLNSRIVTVHQIFYVSQEQNRHTFEMMRVRQKENGDTWVVLFKNISRVLTKYFLRNKAT